MFGSSRPGLTIRLNRRLEQTEVAGRVRETCKQLRIRLCNAQAFEQTLHRIHSVALVDLNVRVEIVRQRKIGVEFESPLDRDAPLLQFLHRSSGKFGQHPTRPPQTSPCRRVCGVERDTLLIQADGFREPGVLFARFIRAQVQVVRSRIGRRIVGELLPLTCCQRQRERVDDAAHQRVLQLKRVAQLHLQDAFDQIRVPLGASTN